MRVPALAAGLLALPLLASAAGSAGLAQGVTKKVLPNGLTVIIKPISSAPVVAINAWVRVGSVNERDDERGITHFIEHMLFKGTDKLKVGELDRALDRGGCRESVSVEPRLGRCGEFGVRVSFVFHGVFAAARNLHKTV